MKRNIKTAVVSLLTLLVISLTTLQSAKSPSAPISVSADAEAVLIPVPTPFFEPARGSENVLEIPVEDNGGSAVGEVTVQDFVVRGFSSVEGRLCTGRTASMVDGVKIGKFPGTAPPTEAALFKLTTTYEFARRSAGRSGKRIYHAVHADLTVEPSFESFLWAVYAASIGLRVFLTDSPGSRLVACLNPTLHITLLPAGTQNLNGVNPLVLRTPYEVLHTMSPGIVLFSNLNDRTFFSNDAYRFRKGSCFGLESTTRTGFLCGVSKVLIPNKRFLTKPTVDEGLRCGREISTVPKEMRYDVYVLESGIKIAVHRARAIGEVVTTSEGNELIEIDTGGVGASSFTHAASGGFSTVVDSKIESEKLVMLTKCFNPTLSSRVRFKRSIVATTNRNCLLSTQDSNVYDVLCRHNPWTEVEVEQMSSLSPNLVTTPVAEAGFDILFPPKKGVKRFLVYKQWTLQDQLLRSSPGTLYPVHTDGIFAQISVGMDGGPQQFIANLLSRGFTARVGSCGSPQHTDAPTILGLISNGTATAVDVCFSA
eukprot:TRINITY_DN7108_c0_g1_i2.p1 TRINITY_DN7108_c0_g1~~TRINITY_DN7108_c0_g1_i2.p1  ORF type:complete len:538 (+),score=41.16 TRINITY_DN7108_c0_g1_i2:56-1669(+)